MRKLVVLGAGALAATSIGLLSAGVASSQPQKNVIGAPYYKAVKILKGQGLSTGFGGSVGSALPQAQCMVSSQKMTSNGRMLLNLDCSEEAAQQLAEASAGAGGTAGGPAGTLRPPQIPIAPGSPAPAPAPAG